MDKPVKTSMNCYQCSQFPLGAQFSGLLNPYIFLLVTSFNEIFGNPQHATHTSYFLRITP